MRIFFSVGEPSGDLHGANFIAAIRKRSPEIECVGYGGPRMAEAGCELHVDLTQMAIMGFAKVLGSIPKFWRLYRSALESFRREPPDAVVLIDFPGFNWWIARAAKRYGIPVFYYGTPQIWAWAQWRAKKMRRLVDHALCKLPFEEKWMRQRGINATYVGHPFFDELETRQLDEKFLADYSSRPGPLVTILPGSRTQEVKMNLASFLKAAALVKQQTPEVRFAIAAFKESQAESARLAVAQCGLDIEVFVGRTPELMHLAHCCMSTSGSVSLELLYHTRPSVMLYRVRLPIFLLVRVVLARVKYMTLVNLLADDTAMEKVYRGYNEKLPQYRNAVLPEYPTWRDKSKQIARHINTWLEDDAAHLRCVARLRELKAEVAHGGASQRAAEYVLDQLQHKTESKDAAA